ncbi:GHMP kinase [Aliidongia dinghuensis]|uniref:GHMP kinase n=1 Tax=Aliidongia dinghuensis TaxID=1867774 RepID=A0A8J2YVK3_9PROT|nr:kinase [Aliidongia dinghuensis]GGF23978.1 GHMP kinase [Aliidongia dinghuensis]
MELGQVSAGPDDDRELQPHVISRTPFRLSFFGGGSDYPAWYLKHGGAVLSGAINKYCYISCRRLPPFFGIRHRIVWSHIETVNSISEILHPAVRVGLQMLGHKDADGIELHHEGDLPARSGIGSSSSFAVGMINVVSAMHGRRLTRHELALAAIDLEQNWLKDHVGSQDQVAAAYGGLNVIRFNTDGSIGVEPIGLAPQRRELLEGRLMMFFAGTTRLSTDLAKKLIDNLDAKRREIEAMEQILHQAIPILKNGDLDDMGNLLHESWLLKRSLTSSISNDTVDDIYDTARAAGALGGKLLGAGQAGFMAFYVPERSQDKVRAALRNLIEVPIRFDFSGSTLINLEEV